VKKIVIAGMLTIGMSLFAEVSLKNSENVDKLGFAILSEHVEKVDHAKAGGWYLYHLERKLYKSVVNNEFEIQDAIANGYKKLLVEVEKNKPLLNDEFYITMIKQYGKYNFEEHYFPINGMMKESSTWKVAGDNVVGWSADSLIIKFDNTDENLNKLHLEKDKAKELLSKDKNRNLKLKYVFKIKSTDVDFASRIEGCSDKFSRCSKITPSVVGHIVRIEVTDTNTKNRAHIATIVYNKEK